MTGLDTRETTDTTQPTQERSRWASGVIPYKQTGYWDADYVPKDSDILCAFRITLAQQLGTLAQVVAALVAWPTRESEMYLTRGTFSYLPALTDEQIKAQVQYCIDRGWAISIEYTDDPHPRNFLWDMWGLPLFDMKDPAAILLEVNRCREANPQRYLKVNAYDSTLGRQTTALSFIVQRPEHEPGFRLERQEGRDRQLRYTLHPYSADRPPGERYQ